MKVFNVYILFAVLIAAVIVPAQRIYSQARKMYEIRPTSEIKLQGKSNINSFTFRSESVDGRGCIDTTSAAIDSLREPIEDAVNGFFRVDVKSFKSGNSQMNQDMYQALKSKQHPTIEFNLESVEFIQYLDSTRALFTAFGYLRVAGIENLISLDVKVTRTGEERYHLQGDKQILMSDYNIAPPQAWFGLIQARDKLTVEFDLVVGLQSEAIAFKLPCDKSPAHLPESLDQYINMF